MTRAHILRSASFWLALTIPAVPACASARATATVEVPGSSLAQALRQAWAAHGTASLPVNFVPWNATLATLQERAATASSEPSLMLMPDSIVLAGCREGLLQPVDWSHLGPRSAYQTGSDCGLPGYDAALVLAWDRSRDPNAPSWSDFWDVARLPGKRGLPRQARGTLEIALMADGVATGDVYRVLGTPDGASRAFRKLDQLRPYVMWWTDGDAARKALTTGAVLMTVSPAADVTASPAKGGANVAQQWSQALSETLSWSLPRRATNADAAAQILQIEQLASFQDAVSALVPVVGAAPGAAAGLPAAVRDETAAAPHRSDDMLRIDAAFWRDHPDLSTRFEEWLAAAH